MIRLEPIENEDSLYCGICSKQYDNMAKIQINSGLTICLCEECLDELLESVKDFNNTIFCHKCKYFKVSYGGKNYGGRCTLKNRDSDYMSHCNDGELKNV